MGAAAGIVPFLIASWEFGKRIVIQRRCPLCKGSGLVPVSSGAGTRLRKCRQCGGLLPWLGWRWAPPALAPAASLPALLMPLLHHPRLSPSHSSCPSALERSYFLFGTANPGNGGPLLRPRGQTSVFYAVPPKPQPRLMPDQPEGSSSSARGDRRQPE